MHHLLSAKPLFGTMLTGESHPKKKKKKILEFWILVLLWTFNSLAPGKFEWNFRHVMFKQILGIDGWDISCEIILVWISLFYLLTEITHHDILSWKELGSPWHGKAHACLFMNCLVTIHNMTYLHVFMLLSHTVVVCNVMPIHEMCVL